MIKGWITYSGRVVNIEEMSHQHMSNIYYYVTMILPSLYDNLIKEEIKEHLNRRFDGVILPYHPHSKFFAEHQFLKEKGYLKENGMIVVNNEVIGSLDFNIN